MKLSQDVSLRGCFHYLLHVPELVNSLNTVPLIMSFGNCSRGRENVAFLFAYVYAFPYRGYDECSSDDDDH